MAPLSHGICHVSTARRVEIASSSLQLTPHERHRAFLYPVAQRAVIPAARAHALADGEVGLEA
jgi:hypothetical protein